MNPIMILLGILFLSACGVKGDPMPPEKAAELGRGRPTYKRAMKDINVAPVAEDPEEEDEDKEEEE
jgi:hypothetical protein